MSDHLWESYDEDPAELCRRCNDWPCCCNREEEIDHTEPMPDAEVLEKAAAFDPTPAEEFLSWAKAVDPDRPPACPCPGCEVVAKEVKAAKIMRLTLQMIVKQAHQRGIGIEPTSEQSRAYFALSDYGKGVAEGLDRARRIAEQALRECGN